MIHDSNWKQIKQIFTEALELEEGERKLFIRKACEDEDKLREEVLSLLRAHEEPGALDRSMDEIRMSAVSDARVGYMKGRKSENTGLSKSLVMAEWEACSWLNGPTENLSRRLL